MTDLDGCGFSIADIRLSSEQCNYISAALPSVSDQRGGRRGLLAHPTILQLVRHKQLAHLLWSVTGRELVAVAARLLDDTSQKVSGWHQHRLVAVRERLDVQGYGPWKTIAGIPYVEPPSSVLRQMVIVRVHLDNCPPESHALEIVPGSHRAGKLAADAIQRFVDSGTSPITGTTRGALSLMRPLLLHSGIVLPARTRYRVLHIEFAPAEAISPLQWHETVQLHRAA